MKSGVFDRFYDLSLLLKLKYLLANIFTIRILIVIYFNFFGPALIPHLQPEPY